MTYTGVNWMGSLLWLYRMKYYWLTKWQIIWHYFERWGGSGNWILQNKLRRQFYELYDKLCRCLHIVNSEMAENFTVFSKRLFFILLSCWQSQSLIKPPRSRAVLWESEHRETQISGTKGNLVWLYRFQPVQVKQPFRMLGQCTSELHHHIGIFRHTAVRLLDCVLRKTDSWDKARLNFIPLLLDCCSRLDKRGQTKQQPAIMMLVWLLDRLDVCILSWSPKRQFIPFDISLWIITLNNKRRQLFIILLMWTSFKYFKRKLYIVSLWLIYFNVIFHLVWYEKEHLGQTQWEHRLNY